MAAAATALPCVEAAAEAAEASGRVNQNLAN